MKHSKNKQPASDSASAGFSLIELLTAMVILSVLMLMMTSLLDQVQRSWRFGEDRISQFREARVAFDLMTKNMSQATMNTYWDYRYSEAGLVEAYEKRTELHFYADQAKNIESRLGLSNKTEGHAVFFQAPLGYSVRYRNLNNLFNGRGYLIVHDNDDGFRPQFVQTQRTRYRLMEFRPPAEANQVFLDATEGYENKEPQIFESWWNQGEAGVENSGSFADHLNPLAENIILLTITPMDSLEDQTNDRFDTSSRIAPGYTFDSNRPLNEVFKQQVPPLIKVTMVAIDETTAVQLEDEFGTERPPIIPQNLFQDSAMYNEDVTTLKEHFDEINRDKGFNINYRVFSSVVMLRAAKWLTLDPEAATTP